MSGVETGHQGRAHLERLNLDWNMALLLLVKLPLMRLSFEADSHPQLEVSNIDIDNPG